MLAWRDAGRSGLKAMRRGGDVGESAPRLPNTLCIALPGLKAETAGDGPATSPG